MDMKININSVEKINDKVIEIFETPFVKYAFLIFVIIRILYIDKIGDWFLEQFNSTKIKILYAIFVAYAACFDPLYSIALTTLIIISIQELNNRKQLKALHNHKQLYINSNNTSYNKDYNVNNNSNDNSNLNINKNVSNVINNAEILQPKKYNNSIKPNYLDLSNNISSKKNINNDLAFNTLTNNIYFK